MIGYDLKVLGTKKISFYLGLEKFLLKTSEENCFFLWNVSRSLIIGRHQLLCTEIDMNKAEADGCPVFRRPSGGGAVYADEGCLMYSFIVAETGRDELFKVYPGKIRDALCKLGISAFFSSRNDLVIKDENIPRKISGSAVYYERGRAVLHGTLLYDTDLEKMAAYLTPGTEKIFSKGVKGVKSRVANLKPFLKTLSKKELSEYLLTEIATEIRKPSDLLIREASRNAALFDNPRPDRDPPYTIRREKRFAFGAVVISIDVKRNIIDDFRINGDFFDKKDPRIFGALFQKKSFVPDTFSEILRKNDIGDYIEGMKNTDLIDIMKRE